MAHKIMALDGAVFAEKPAWHGLGLVVKDAPTPEEALVLAKLNWEVGQDQLFQARDGALVTDHVQNYRMDTGLPLGVVGKGYQPVQNRELAEMAYVVKGQSDRLEVESAFSMNNCRRVVFTIRADEFLAQNDDVVKMYLCLANGHDGSLALVWYFTSERVVCNNTFQASRAAASRTDGYGTFRHEGDMEVKIKEAKRAVEAYATLRRQYGDKVQALASYKMTKEEMDSLITDAIIFANGPIPTKDEAAKDTRKKTKREKAMTAYLQIGENFNEEREMLKSSPNAWLAFNACTKWLQHQRPQRGKDDEARQNAKAFSDMFGIMETTKGKIWDRALQLVK
jgi:phage/plasmid-like protein (TIGR03299 family)